MQWFYCNEFSWNGFNSKYHFFVAVEHCPFFGSDLGMLWLWEDGQL